MTMFNIFTFRLSATADIQHQRSNKERPGYGYTRIAKIELLSLATYLVIEWAISVILKSVWSNFMTIFSS